jgi:hypothetical protein
MTKSGVGIRSWGRPSKKVEQRGPVLDRRPCGYGPTCLASQHVRSMRQYGLSLPSTVRLPVTRTIILRVARTTSSWADPLPEHEGVYDGR